MTIAKLSNHSMLRPAANLALIALVSLAGLFWSGAAGSPGQLQAQVPSYEDFAHDELAHQGPLSDSVVRLTAVAKKTVVPQGGDIPIALVFDIAPNWHIWLPEQVELGISEIERFEFAVHTKIVSIGSVPETTPRSLNPNEGFLHWPAHHTHEADLGSGVQTFGSYSGRTVAFLPATIPQDAPLGITTLQIRTRIQACDPFTCKQPAEIIGSVEIEIVAAGTSSQLADVGDVFSTYPPSIYEPVYQGVAAPDLVKFDIFGYEWVIDAGGAGLYLLLLISALGGFLLNLTPCVLPVIPLKIMGLSQSAQGSRIRTITLGLALGAGVIGFWLLLGFLISSVSSFTASNQLFQYPWFTIVVGTFIAIMAIGMCGLFSFELPQFVYKFNPGHESLVGSFLFGIMTAILSTPCTAPFMGAAAGWAATKSAGVTMMVFASIGLGMALPYIVLSIFPQLVSRMPRSGPASELIKQVMGLLMLAAASYFIGVGVSGIMVSPPNPPSKFYWWLVATPLALAGIWLALRTFQITGSAFRRLLFGSLGVLLVLGAAFGAVRFTEKGPIDWTYYTHQRFDDALANGQVVVLEFTAEWCLNCKALEENVLRNKAVVAAIADKGVQPIKVDITKGYPDANERLVASGRLTIPLLQIFSPDGKEIFKSDAYTRAQVLEAIREARSQ